MSNAFSPSRFVAPLSWVLLWALVTGVALATRPLLPMDETRYLAVAWEMWRDGQFLVPHLNGETYSHKPPLLFWLMHAGWTTFGPVEWWPRLVAPLFGLAALALTSRLARALWPERPGRAHDAPLLLFGGLFWTLFTTVTMFDMLLAAFSLMGLLGLVRAWRGRMGSGFALLALAIGLGVLAKGPAILLHLLPVALLAPWWGPALAPQGFAGSWKRWYGALLLAVLGGAGLALLWAIPAGRAGGPDYQNAIFWGQSAGRMIQSFAHGRPWWWYLAVLPPMLLPWLLWPRLWRGARAASGLVGDGGVRFCLVWFLPAFIAFSLISGKQLHYLLPELPAVGLLFAAVIEAADDRPRDRRVPAGLVGLLGAVASLAWLAPHLPWSLPSWLADLHPLWGLLPLAGALVVMRLRLENSVASLATLSALLVVSAHLIAQPRMSQDFDLEPLAKRLGALEALGRPLANYGKYHGQYHFLGRLRQPIATIGDGEVVDWVDAFPDGLVITYQSDATWEPGLMAKQPFRGRFIEVWEAEAVAADPEIVRRAP